MKNQENNEVNTFYKLISNYKIEIPMMQRDYAQGRSTYKDKLDTFLDKIQSHLFANNPENPLELDFIYGNVKESNDGDIFNPIDGQQRLTTLFLLHWYALEVNEGCDNGINIKFTYDTRESSRRFCENLVDKSNSIDIISFNENNTDNKNKLSDVIKDSTWFSMAWVHDPSISAMLNAIDLINEKFKDVKYNLWDRLTNSNDLIRFHLLKMEDLGMSDDLYIKMNARGKPLTKFEIFKAELQNKINENKWEKDIENPMERFAYKIDGTWTDFIWNCYCKDPKNPKSVDEAHMNFIKSLTVCKIALDESYGSNKSRGSAIENILTKDNNCKYLLESVSGSRKFKDGKEQVEVKEVFDYIWDCYELYADLCENNALPDNENLTNILKGGASHQDRVVFYAQTEYLLRYKNINKEKFKDWVHVVNNISGAFTFKNDNNTIRSSSLLDDNESFCGAMSLVSEILKGFDNNKCDDIYLYLSEHSFNSTFAKEQQDDEIIKAKIIEKYPDRKSLILELEQRKLLKNRIRFALECACYDGDIEKINYDVLKEVNIILRTYFDHDDDLEKNEFDLFRRVMLTIKGDGNYQFYRYWYARSRNFSDNYHAYKYALFPKFNHIQCFIHFTNPKTDVDRETNNKYFKELIKLLSNYEIPSSPELVYKQIIDEFIQKPDDMSGWQFNLIKDDSLWKNDIKYIALAYCDNKDDEEENKENNNNDISEAEVNMENEGVTEQKETKYCAYWEPGPKTNETEGHLINSI